MSSRASVSRRGQIVARLVADDAQIALRRAEADLAVAEAALVLAVAEHDAAARNWAEPFELVRAVEAGRAALHGERGRLRAAPDADRVRRNAVLKRLEEETRSASGDPHPAAPRASSSSSPPSSERSPRGRTSRHWNCLEPHALGPRRAPPLELRAAERDARAPHRGPPRVSTPPGGRRSRRGGADVARAAAVETRRPRTRTHDHPCPDLGVRPARLKVPGDKVMRAVDDRTRPHPAPLRPREIQVRVDVPLADAAFVSSGSAARSSSRCSPIASSAASSPASTHEADLQKNTLQAKVGVIDPGPRCSAPRCSPA
jgi:hypothetical protein